MSSLLQQLSNLKKQNVSSAIGPNIQHVSILPDTHNSRFATLDVLYTMAIISYSKIKGSLLHTVQEHAKEVLCQENKEINRNSLTKEQNQTLSLTIRKFLLHLTPFLKNLDCQKILEYLIRNFKIHVFEGQALAIMFIHYWQYPIYAKICKILQVKGQLTNFIKALGNPSTAIKKNTKADSPSQLNQSFIVKNILYNHSLCEQIILYCSQYMKLQSTSDFDIKISVDNEDDNVEDLTRLESKNFVFELFRFIIEHNQETHYKHITKFCLENVSSRTTSFEGIAISMVLLTQMILHQTANKSLINTFLRKLVKKITNEYPKMLRESIYSFIILVWQRCKDAIDGQIVSYLVQENQKSSFRSYLVGCGCSTFMIFRSLFRFYLIEEIDCLSLMKVIVLKVKTEEFLRLHSEEYFADLFKLYFETKGQNISLKQSPSKKEKKRRLAFQAFLVENVGHELADFMNHNKEYFNVEQANKIFKNANANVVIGNNGIELSTIPKILPQQKEIEMQVQSDEKNEMKQQSEQDSQEENTKKAKVTILQHLRKNKILTKRLNLSEERIQQGVLNLVKQYYSRDLSSTTTTSQKYLTQEQKNSLLENEILLPFYTQEMFKVDLQNQDWLVPIRFLLFHSKSQSNKKQALKKVQESRIVTLINFSQEILQQPCVQKDLTILQDILYRQACRISHAILASYAEEGHYKKVTDIIGRLYHKYTVLLNDKNNEGFIFLVNDFCLKLSRSLIEKTGTSHGKFYKMIHTHSKMFSIMVLNCSKYTAFQLEQVKKVYIEIISIFGKGQLYLINAGIIELLNKSNVEMNHMKIFTKIITQSLSQGNSSILKEFEGKDSKAKQVMRIDDFTLSIGRILAFCDTILKETEEPVAEINSEGLQKYYSGIAKKMIVSFYGLTKDKQKRSIVKKVMLFLNTIFTEPAFIKCFEYGLQILKSGNSKMLKSLLKQYSSIYKIVNSLGERYKIVQKFTTKILKSMVNVFPLESRLQIFKYLLPDANIYSIIGEQLQAHPKFNDDNLQEIFEIMPQKVEANWIILAKECLKRGYQVSSEFIEKLLSLEQVNSSNLDSIVKLICDFSAFQKESLLPILDKTMSFILKKCEEKDDLALAIATKIIENLQDLVQPYLETIFLNLIQIDSKYMGQFIQSIVRNLSKPSLINLIKSTYKVVANHLNFTIFMNEVIKKGVKDTFFKVIQNFYSITINKFIESQSDMQSQKFSYLEILQTRQAEGFVEMSLSLNEDQLRKSLINLIAWSQKKNLDQELQLPFNCRKTVVLKVFSKLAEKLGSLFTSFYGYIWQGLVQDIISLNKRFALISSKQRNVKRSQLPNSAFAADFSQYYFKEILIAMKTLFQRDSEKDFLDGSKFDSLSEPISQIFLILNIGKGDEYKALMNNYLSPCLLSLCSYLLDDYQFKTLNYKILLLLKEKNGQVQEAIYDYLLRMIEKIRDKSLLLVGDLARFLAESMSSRNQKVRNLVREISFKIKDLSGEDIQSYI